MDAKDRKNDWEDTRAGWVFFSKKKKKKKTLKNQVNVGGVVKFTHNEQYIPFFSPNRQHINYFQYYFHY